MKITRFSFFCVLAFALLAAVPAPLAQLNTINYFPSGLDVAIYGITAGPDGAIWYTGSDSSGKNTIGRMTITGHETLFAEGAIFPYYMAPGSDGELWFTDGGTNSVGRLCAQVSGTCRKVGDVTEYPIPTPNSYPTGIATGSDGALWFAESNAFKIGRITTSGSITEYPKVSGYPAEIVPGPDGNLWFTEPLANAIGRITPSGSVTEFTVPTNGSLPLSITVGADGALWFTENYNFQIGRITTKGHFTGPYASPVTEPFEIAAGPDGSLWFSSYGDNIGRMTTAGAGKSFQTTGYAYGIASGPDGALWFAGNSPSSIGQAIPSARRNGIDASNNQGCLLPKARADFIKQAGVTYATVKASQTGSMKLNCDPHKIDVNAMAIAIAQQQLDMLSGAGIKTAAYCYLHFAKNAQNGTQQATNCLNTVGTRPISFMAIDVEDWPSENNRAPLNTRIAIIDDALQTIASALGTTPVIYTYASRWNSITGNSTNYSPCPLWNGAAPTKDYPDFWSYVDPAGNYLCFPGTDGILPNLDQGDGLPSLSAFTPFGGWTQEHGNQYDIGYTHGKGHISACLDGFGADFDAFADSLFQQ